MKYQLRMYYADAANQTAGSKATRDCSQVLVEMGYRCFDVPIFSRKHRLVNLLTLLQKFVKLYFALRSADTVLIQYPLLGINRWLKYFVGLLASKNCKLVCLLHDLDALRHVHHTWTLEGEVLRLKAFDLLIVHNSRMQILLQEQGLRLEMRCLRLFDYLLPEAILDAIHQKMAAKPRIGPYTCVAFAGNLGKSGFLKKLNQVEEIQFKLYGPGYEALENVKGLEWVGSFDADELPEKLQADFGLIWDGEDICACTGYLGQYLNYNNPHKASLYLLAGLPLIAPRNTAIGDFIQASGVGFTVDSLLDLPEKLKVIDEAAYKHMTAAIQPLSQAIASGAFLRKILEDM